MDFTNLCRVLTFALGIMFAPFAALANSPEELVRWIYQSATAPGPHDSKSLSFLTSPQNRASYLTSQLAAYYDASDTYGDDLMMTCVGFDPSAPGSDTNPQEVNATLDLVSTQSDAEWRVDARFSNLGYPHHITYVFQPEAGAWKLGDIISNGKSLVARPCTPKVNSGPNMRGSGYCYINGTNWLSLDIGGLGDGLIDLESWQNQHACGLDAQISAISGGWIAKDPQGVTSCEVHILAAPEGGLRLSATPGCSFFCGMRASLDQMYFPAASQVHCSQMVN